MNSSNFIHACYQQEINQVPVWIMRQAGRYLKSYRDLRTKYTFSEMYKNPDIATEVTLLPFKELDVDAAILFSDILTVPEAMGLELNFYEKQGPVFSSTVRTVQELNNLNEAEAAMKMSFVYTSIKQIKKELPNPIPLIGFCGAPWTLATYMIEGKGSKEYENCLTMRYAQPLLLDSLLEKVTNVLLEYLRLQIEAGADAIQIFDSWVGILDEEYFIYYLKYIRKIVDHLKKYNVPIIYFPKGAGQWLHHLKELNINVVGLDWGIQLGRAKNIVGNQFALQGNLHPRILTAPLDTIQKSVIHTLDSYRLANHGSMNGYIANLGHGIFPEASLDAAKCFVDTVKNYIV